MADKLVYRVFIDDNFHYMDEEDRYELGTFDDCASAIAACKKIVDEFLAQSYKEGMTFDELWNQYLSFGEDPWIATDDLDCRKFSSWDYAKEKTKEFCQDSPSGPVGRLLLRAKHLKWRRRKMKISYDSRPSGVRHHKG